jgi:phenylacetate-CoA ligase
LGASVFHWYGHSERVVQAGQGIVDELLYFWPSYGFVEFGPVNEDGLCEVIGTSFHNAVMPLIRYRTGDLVRLAAPQVRREWPWSAVVEVAGREHDFLVSNCGRRVSLTTLNMHDLTFDGMLAVQFVQEQPGQVILCYVTGNGWDSTQTERARMAVMQKLGPGFHLEMRQVVSVKKTKSGKHRWLISAMEEVAIPS